MIRALRSLVRYRALIESLVSRELKARYRGSVLGFLWSFVNPLLLLLTYTLVFTVILPNRQPDIQPFFLFLFCGILPWTWFQASVAESAGVLIAGGNLIKKVLFPAEVLPDRVNILAEIGERAEQIDAARAEAAKTRAESQLKAIRDEAGYAEAHQNYIRAVTRLSVARREP